MKKQIRAEVVFAGGPQDGLVKRLPWRAVEGGSYDFPVPIPVGQLKAKTIWPNSKPPDPKEFVDRYRVVSSLRVYKEKYRESEKAGRVVMEYEGRVEW